jgi:hypothetical protein
MRKVPTGIMVLVALHSIAVLIFIVHAIISIPFILVTLFDESGLGALALYDIFWTWILLSISGIIVAGLLNRKDWSRTLVMALAGIGVVFGIIDILSGNMFAVFSVIINGVIIYYMRKPHIVEWFTLPISKL